MRLTKSEREQVRQRFDGRCAYCGCPLGDRWHADHFEPVIRQSVWQKGAGFKPTGDVLHPARHRLENLMPACAPCNIDKAGNSLDFWRDKLSRSAEVLTRNSSTFRHAVRFGLVSETGASVVFHFERAR